MNILLNPKERKTWFNIQKEGFTSCEDKPEGWRLRIRRQTYDVPEMPKTLSDSCCCNIFWLDKQSSPASQYDAGTMLEYPVLDTEPGRFCVYWDDLLFKLPPGKYKATLVDRANYQLGGFNLLIPKTKFNISKEKGYDANCC